MNVTNVTHVLVVPVLAAATITVAAAVKKRKSLGLTGGTRVVTTAVVAMTNAAVKSSATSLTGSIK
jgi:hypothetical protein